MKNLKKISINSVLLLLAFVGICAFSCTRIYFEKPVPEQGSMMRSIPDDWAGIYMVEFNGSDEPSEFEQLFPQCFRLEKVSETQLLVASEYRIHESSLPRLREALDEQKNEGELLDYLLTENMLLSTVLNEEGNIVQQYTALLKTGPWYVLTQTMQPFQLYDLRKGQSLEFDADARMQASDAKLPDADSIALEESKLVARQNNKGWYLNTQKAGEEKWSLLYVEQSDKDRLVVKHSILENSEDFKNRLDYYNSITPIRETESDRYEIDPTDKALERLLAEDGLLQTTRLRRIQ